MAAYSPGFSRLTLALALLGAWLLSSASRAEDPNLVAFCETLNGSSDSFKLIGPSQVLAGSAANLVTVSLPTSWADREVDVRLLNPGEAALCVALTDGADCSPQPEVKLLIKEGMEGQFYLKPEPRTKLRPANTRTLRLLFRASGVSPVTITLPVVAPDANLEISHSQEYRFRLTRTSPWQTAGGVIHLPLVETSGRSSVEILGVELPQPHGEPTVGFEIKACSPVLNEPCEETSGPFQVSLGLPAGSSSDLPLAIEGFPSVGAFELDLLLSSDDLNSMTILPIEIIVTDGPIIPLLAIVTGVLLAVLVMRSVQRVQATRALDRLISKTPAAQGGSLRLLNHMPMVPKGLVLRKVESAVEEDLKPTLLQARQNIEAMRLQAGDIGTVVLAILLGSALGFQELYFVEFFGTAQHYLGAVLWGFGSRLGLLVVETLVGMVAGRG